MCGGDYCCTGVCRGGLTDDGAALAVSGQLVVEDDEEHGEAEHQRHLEGVALAAPQRQGEAHHVGQDDEDAGQHESDEGVEVFDGECNLRGAEGGRCTIRNTARTLDCRVIYTWLAAAAHECSCYFHFYFSSHLLKFDTAPCCAAW